MIGAVALIALIVLVVVPFVRWRTEHFVITNHHVFFRTGLLSRREHQIPLGQIANMETEVTFWGRLMGYGSLIVESSADQPLKFRNVASLSKVQSQLNQLIRDERERMHRGGRDLPDGDDLPTRPTRHHRRPLTLRRATSSLRRVRRSSTRHNRDIRPLSSTRPAGYPGVPDQQGYPQQGYPTQQGYPAAGLSDAGGLSAAAAVPPQGYPSAAAPVSRRRRRLRPARRPTRVAPRSSLDRGPANRWTNPGSVSASSPAVRRATTRPTRPRASSLPANGSPGSSTTGRSSRTGCSPTRWPTGCPPTASSPDRRRSTADGCA